MQRVIIDSNVDIHTFTYTKTSGNDPQVFRILSRMLWKCTVDRYVRACVRACVCVCVCVCVCERERERERARAS